MRRFCYLLVPVLFLVGHVPAALASDAFDVSYVWSRNLSGVRSYQDKVAKVLGPAVAKHLAVVDRNGLFGLLYLRRGDGAGAKRVAQSHTRLLRAKGLEAASPILAQDWKRVDGAAWRQAGPTTSRHEKVASHPPARREHKPEAHDLEVAVEKYIDHLREEGRIAPDERTGWSVYDFTTGQKLVTINEDEKFQTASMVKPFLAAAFFDKVRKGELIYGSVSRRHMEHMIQDSSNSAANWVMRQVGGPRAAQGILQRDYPRIFKDTHIVEYIPPGGRTYRNKASVHDYSRFLYAVWKNDIAGAREIKRLMALPGADRVYTSVSEVPEGTRVYDKTGSTAHLCGDMGILSVRGADGRRYPYILIGIIEKRDSASNYSDWIRSRGNVIRQVSAIVYDGIVNDLHGRSE